MDRIHIRRRTLLGSGIALAAGLPVKAAAPVFAYVGCFTTAKRNGRGDGIHVYRMDPASGTLTHIQHLGDLVNPSFLVLSRDHRFLYSVHGDQTYATSFTVDRDSGRIEMLNRAQTGGENGAHLALDPSGRFLVVANYASGSVAVLPVRPDGKLADQVQLVPLTGKPGPHRTEQASSHPHCIVFDPSGRFVIVPDKGLDRVFTFRFDPATGRLTPTEQGSVVARSGAAPRHAVFHPTLPVVWVVNEIGSSVTTYAWDGKSGSLRPMQILSTVPEDYTGDNSGAEITVSAQGKFVYASNRGHNSVAIFAAHPANGKLTSAGWVSTQGKTPRLIGFDPSYRFLFAANEQSDTVVTLRADSNNGSLAPTGQTVRNATPVTIAFGG